MQLRRLICCVCLFVVATTTASSAAVNPNEMTVRVTYSKVMLAHEIDQMRSDLMRNQPSLADNEHLRLAVSNVRLGSVDEILNESIASLITKPSGMVLDGNLGMAEIPGNDRRPDTRKALKLSGWKIAPYLSENWNLPFSEFLSTMDEVRFSRFASFQVIATFMGQQRQYSALFLFGTDASGKERVLGVDHILGMNLINELLNTPVDKTVMELQSNFADRHSVRRLLHSMQPEIGCERDSKSQFCCHATSGHCGVQGLLPVSAPPTGVSLLLGPKVLSQSSSETCAPICSVYNSSENAQNAGGGDTNQHNSGSHTGKAQVQGQCTYTGTQLPCIPTCHVAVSNISTNETGSVVGGCHKTSGSWAFMDGQNSCTGQAGWGAVACAEFCNCAFNIGFSVGENPSITVTSGGGTSIWSSPAQVHNWACNTIPR